MSANHRFLQAALAALLLAPAARAAAVEKDVLDELVVDLDDRVSDRQVGELERRYDVSFLPDSSYVGVDRVYRVRVHMHGRREADRPALLQRALDALKREPTVEAADPAYVYYVPELGPQALTRAGDEALPVAVSRSAREQREDKVFPNDPKYRYQWHMEQIHMPSAWALAQGAGVTVAVIDTGVTQVEDLRGTELLPGWNFVDNNANARDDHGHGTHVAGTIAQTTHNGIGVAGVAYKARIMPIKVLSAQGSGSVGGIAEGIRWAADHGANVINMSLGGRFNSQVLAKAVKYAHDHGVVVVCAAGNDGKGRVSFPAANAGAIAVAATQYDEATTFYSNWGREIAVAAPGGNTRLDQNEDGVPDGVLQNTVTPGNIDKQDYLLFMGTSMAAPHVAGIAALIYGSGVHRPAQVESILRRTARKPAQYRGKHDDRYGTGIVDAAAAVRVAKAEAMQAGASYRPHRCACSHGAYRTGHSFGFYLLVGLAGLLLLGLAPLLGLGLLRRLMARRSRLIHRD